MESLGKRRGMSAVLSSIFSNRVTMLPGPHAYPIRARRLPHDESWVGNMLGLMIFHGAKRLMRRNPVAAASACRESTRLHCACCVRQDHLPGASELPGREAIPFKRSEQTS
jgi:hypothetical protein